MKNMNWKKIVGGIVLIVTVAAGAFTGKPLSVADVQKVFDGATLIVDGVDEPVNKTP